MSKLAAARTFFGAITLALAAGVLITSAWQLNKVGEYDQRYARLFPKRGRAAIASEPREGGY